MRGYECKKHQKIDESAESEATTGILGAQIMFWMQRDGYSKDA